MSDALPPTTVVPAPGVLRRSVGGVTVLALEEGVHPPLRLGQLASLVWACLEVGGTSAEIAADILAEFSEATVEALVSGSEGDVFERETLASRCFVAVQHTVKLLQKHGLVVPGNPPSPCGGPSDNAPVVTA